MFTKATFGIGAGLLSEFVVEFFRVPGLSEHDMFGNKKLTNYEVIVYAISAAGSAAGIMDFFSGSKPLGFSKEFMPYFLGFGTGTAIYEHVVAPHLTSIDPYKIVYDAIPSFPLL
jgi:hypothetical protein